MPLLREANYSRQKYRSHWEILHFRMKAAIVPPLLLKRGSGRREGEGGRGRKKRMGKWANYFAQRQVARLLSPGLRLNIFLGGISYTLLLFPANKLRFRSVHHPSNIVTTRTTYFSLPLPSNISRDTIDSI